MNKIKLLLRNLGILFEFLPIYYMECFAKFKKDMSKTRKGFFRLPNSPKMAMRLSLIISIIFAINNNWFFTGMFFIIALIFYFYKIWISGDPMKWYNQVHLVKTLNK